MSYQETENDKASRLMEETAAEVRTKATFAGLEISVDDPKALGPECDQLVQGAGGLLMVILPPQGKNTKPAVFSALHFGEINFGIMVYENPELNRCPQGKQKRALACAIDLNAALHGFRPACANVMIVAEGWDPVEDPTLLAYRVNLKTSLIVQSNADLQERRPV